MDTWKSRFRKGSSVEIWMFWVPVWNSRWLIDVDTISVSLFCWSLHVIAASFSVHVMKVASQHDRGLFLFSQTQNRFGKCMLLQMVFSVNEINPCMNPTTMAIIKITTLSAICPAQRILLVQKHLYETSTWMKKGFGWLRRRNLSACTTPEILDGNKHLP